MSRPSSNANAVHDLESVIATTLLDRRATRKTDREAEARALISLTRELARAPEQFFDKLVQAALDLSNADSTGISLLNKAEGRFVWPAVAGKLVPYIGGGTPSDFGPCGTVIDRQTTILFQHPELHFTYLEPIRPFLEEVLLIPFYLDGKAVGTLWAVSHELDHKFDAEDRRLLESLSTFAASAYETLAASGALDPMLRMTLAGSQLDN